MQHRRGSPSHGAARILGVVLALGLGACTGANDPVDGEGKWRPARVNDANLRAMIADPAHLSLGVGATSASGTAGAAAIERLNTDRLKPLPDVRLAPVGGGGGGSGEGGGGGG